MESSAYSPSSIEARPITPAPLLTPKIIKVVIQSHLTPHIYLFFFLTLYPPAWCATEINYAGEVINQKWGDCEPDCTLLTKIGPPPPPPPPPPASPPPPPPSTTSRTSSTLQDGNDINIGDTFFPFLFIISYIIFRTGLWTVGCDNCPLGLTRNFALQNQG